MAEQRSVERENRTLTNDNSTIAVRSGEDLDWQALDRHLRSVIPGLSGDMEISQFPGGKSNLTYHLKYTDDEKSVMLGIQKISTPGLRRYADKKHIPRIQGGLGVAILTTSQGVMTGKEARQKGIGGEVLCRVW